MPADSEQARVCRLKTLIVTHTQESMRARDRQLRVINRQKFEYHTSCYKLLCDCFKFFSKKKSLLTTPNVEILESTGEMKLVMKF